MVRGDDRGLSPETECTFDFVWEPFSRFEAVLGHGASWPCPTRSPWPDFCRLPQKEAPSLCCQKSRFWGDGRGRAKVSPVTYCRTKISPSGIFRSLIFQIVMYCGFILWQIAVISGSASASFGRAAVLLVSCHRLLRTGHGDNKHRQESLHRQG